MKERIPYVRNRVKPDLLFCKIERCAGLPGALARLGHAQIARIGRAVSLPILALGLIGCQDLPVVAQGRYVEIATERDDVICGGTVAYMDDFLDRVFAEIGESPPNRFSVRYEWVEPTFDENDLPHPNDAYATKRVRSTRIVTSQLMHEHELAHAVHQHAWRNTRPVLEEGFAVLFESSRGELPQEEWPEDGDLDSLLEKHELMGRGNYLQSWFIVSQIIDEHGMDGLRDFWGSVRRRSSADRMRRSYQDLFGTSIDTLLEPRAPHERWFEEERVPCYFVTCGEPQPWDGDVWRGEGPRGCADDPNALGPPDARGNGPVERHHVVELEAGARHRFTASVDVAAYLRPCGLQCRPRGFPAEPFWPERPVTRDYPGGRYRVEVLSAQEDLPTDTPGTFEIERLAR